MHSIRVQCKANGVIRLVLDPKAAYRPTRAQVGGIAGQVISPAALRRSSTESDGPSAIRVMRLNVSR